MYTITGTQKEVYPKLFISDKTSFFIFADIRQGGKKARYKCSKMSGGMPTIFTGFKLN